jgi:hypothetical protein
VETLAVFSGSVRAQLRQTLPKGGKPFSYRREICLTAGYVADRHLPAFLSRPTPPCRQSDGFFPKATVGHGESDATGAKATLLARK